MTIEEDVQDDATMIGRSRREQFQEFLDEKFPIGAMCAVITKDGGHLDATTEITTGRLLCSGVDQDESRQRWYELVIDSRGSIGGEPEVLKLWARAPRQHGGSGDLWESDVRTDTAARCILRLNADPPQRWRPTLRMREAVTELYAEDLPSPARSQ